MISNYSNKHVETKQYSKQSDHNIFNLLKIQTRL